MSFHDESYKPRMLCLFIVIVLALSMFELASLWHATSMRRVFRELFLLRPVLVGALWHCVVGNARAEDPQCWESRVAGLALNGRQNLSWWWGRDDLNQLCTY